MKNIIKTTAIVVMMTLCVWGLNAQIKIHSDNHISLMSLTKSGGIQIQPSGYTYFTAELYNDWAWMNLTYAKQNKSKCWIVRNHTLSDVFCVTGEGTIYYKTLLALKPQTQTSRDKIENASEIISRLNGHFFNTNNGSLNYDSLYNELLENEYIAKDAILSLIADYYKKEIGLMASDVEVVLPDAIRTYSDGRKAIDYNAILVVLIEAVKEQREEIHYLRKTIEQTNNYDRIELESGNINKSPIKSAENSINSIENKNSILHQNAPNPFSISTKIEYEINEDIITNSTINIYNLQGTQLKSYPVFKENQVFKYLLMNILRACICTL